MPNILNGNGKLILVIVVALVGGGGGGFAGARAHSHQEVAKNGEAITELKVKDAAIDGVLERIEGNQQRIERENTAAHDKLDGKLDDILRGLRH